MTDRMWDTEKGTTLDLTFQADGGKRPKKADKQCFVAVLLGVESLIPKSTDDQVDLEAQMARLGYFKRDTPVSVPNHPDDPHYWNDAVDAYLIKLVGKGVLPGVIAEDMDRTPGSINARIFTLRKEGKLK